MRNFTLDEFDSPDIPGSGSLMQDSTLEKLDRARDIAGVPFVVNSGYRTQLHNAKVGGSDNSSHLKGYAVDLRCTDSRSRFKMFTALVKAGFTRIGVRKDFIHADDDPNKSPEVIWTY
jgi:uncharacterized protein YcbK (DUF882 family)